jgi:tetratricopeptide (TPR) repeat protein
MQLVVSEAGFPAVPFPPASAGARLTAAAAALEEGRFAEAEREAAACLVRTPEHLEALRLYALAIAAQGDATRAAPLLLRLARERPGLLHPCRELAELHADAPALVAAQFRACRALAPGDARLACTYAEFLLDVARPAAAAAMLRRVLRAAPHIASAHNLLGMALVDLGDLAGAIAVFRRATALAPEAAGAWSNLGMALKIEGRFDESLQAYDRARALAPSDPQIRLNRAVALLRAGRMAEAWEDYESRLEIGGRARLSLRRLLPSLANGVELEGRTVLAWHEEGYGDTIQFARYLPLLAERGARVLAWVPKPLMRLVSTLPGVAEVLTPPAAPPAFDWHIPFFSLPRAFGTTLATIPAPMSYLAADPAGIAAWAARLPAGGLRVGLVWAGQARPWLPGFAALDARRSTDLTTLAPLAQVPGLTLVSLQAGPAARQARQPPPGMVLHDPMGKVMDFADTAAIIANLDAVVSVDTSVAHLAGALGRPVLLLDRYDSCWRWLAGREDSPWYPSLRIFRQPRPGDWAPVVTRVAEALARMAPARLPL